MRLKTEFLTRFALDTYSRYVLRRGEETWITATPWIGEQTVKFDVANPENEHLRWEFMPRAEFDALPVKFY